MVGKSACIDYSVQCDSNQSAISMTNLEELVDNLDITSAKKSPMKTKPTDRKTTSSTTSASPHSVHTNHNVSVTTSLSGSNTRGRQAKLNFKTADSFASVSSFEVTRAPISKSYHVNNAKPSNAHSVSRSAVSGIPRCSRLLSTKLSIASGAVSTTNSTVRGKTCIVDSSAVPVKSTLTPGKHKDVRFVEPCASNMDSALKQSTTSNLKMPSTATPLKATDGPVNQSSPDASSGVTTGEVTLSSSPSCIAHHLALLLSYPDRVVRKSAVALQPFLVNSVIVAMFELLDSTFNDFLLAMKPALESVHPLSWSNLVDSAPVRPSTGSITSACEAAAARVVLPLKESVEVHDAISMSKFHIRRLAGADVPDAIDEFDPSKYLDEFKDFVLEQCGVSVADFKIIVDQHMDLLRCLVMYAKATCSPDSYCVDEMLIHRLFVVFFQHLLTIIQKNPPWEGGLNWRDFQVSKYPQTDLTRLHLDLRYMKSTTASEYYIEDFHGFPDLRCGVPFNLADEISTRDEPVLGPEEMHRQMRRKINYAVDCLKNRHRLVAEQKQKVFDRRELQFAISNVQCLYLEPEYCSATHEFKLFSLLPSGKLETLTVRGGRSQATLHLIARYKLGGACEAPLMTIVSDGAVCYLILMRNCDGSGRFSFLWSRWTDVHELNVLFMLASLAVRPDWLIYFIDKKENEVSKSIGKESGILAHLDWEAVSDLSDSDEVEVQVEDEDEFIFDESSDGSSQYYRLPLSYCSPKQQQ